MVKKIILAGGYDTKNLGDHGMLSVFLKELKEKEKKIKITVLSRHPDKKFDEDYGVHSIQNLDHRTRKESIDRWFNGLNENDEMSHILKLKKELESADLLMIGGGRLLIDKTFGFLRGPLSYYSLLVLLAKFHNVPIMIFAMTIVPIKSQQGIEHLKFILNNSKIITVRDEESKKYLKKIKIDQKKIFVIPDPAYGLNIKEKINKSVKNKINYEEKKIGLNFRISNLNSKTSKNKISLFSKFCDELISKTNSQIMLIPQMTYNVDGIDDDRILHNQIKEKMVNKSKVSVITNELNVKEILEVYKRCSMVFSMRRHGLIFAATQNIPIFSIYAEKNTEAVMKELKLSKYSISLEKFDEECFERLIKSFFNRDKINLKIMNNLPYLKKLIPKYAILALKIINEHKQNATK